MPGYLSCNKQADYPSFVNFCLRANVSAQEVIRSIAESCNVSPKQVALFKKDYNDEFSEVYAHSTISDLSRFSGSSTVIAYILPEEKEAFDRLLLVYPASIMLSTVNMYGSEYYEYLPFSLPFCFLMRSTDSSIELREKIKSFILQPYNVDIDSVTKEITEWESMCKSITEKANHSEKSHSDPFLSSNYLTKYDNDFMKKDEKGLLGGSLSEDSDATVIESDPGVQPELSYQTADIAEDWQSCEPFVPIVTKTYTSNWKSSLLLCNSTLPLHSRLYNQRDCLYVLVAASITSTLKRAVEGTVSSSSYEYFSDKKWTGKEELHSHPYYTAFEKGTVPLYPTDHLKDNASANDQNLYTCLKLFAKRNNLDENNKW